MDNVKHLQESRNSNYQLMHYIQGRTHWGGGGEGPAPPSDLKNTIYSGFHPLNYVICIFEVCF